MNRTLYIIYLIIYYKMSDVNSDISSARASLRNLYDKYVKEFHEINLKIDKYLEGLEVGDEH